MQRSKKDLAVELAKRDDKCGMLSENDTRICLRPKGHPDPCKWWTVEKVIPF